MRERDVKGVDFVGLCLLFLPFELDVKCGLLKPLHMSPFITLIIIHRRERERDVKENS